MKKFFILTLLLASVCGMANARGDFYIGGSVGFMHESASDFDGDKVSTNSFTLLPEFGYNFNDRWALGGVLGYDLVHYCGEDVESYLFRFEPYARFTAYSNDWVSLFIDGTVGYGLGNISSGDEDFFDDDMAVYTVGLKPGVAFNVTKHFSVVAHLGFLGYQGANDSAKMMGYESKGGFWVDGNSLNLGFYYKF